MVQNTHHIQPKTNKMPFDIDRIITLIRQAVEPYPKAAMFELADQGYNKPFEQLLACIISIRTLDEISIPTARRFFERARTPAEVAQLTVAEIDQLIHACSFHARKAAQVKAIAERVLNEFWGELPCEEPILLSFPGVGVKCAHLTLGVACGDPYISVDIHVHRISNRWGYVATSTPENTMLALEKKLPLKYWIEINRLLVPFGKHICTAQRPRCSTCLLLQMCQQVGVVGTR